MISKHLFLLINESFWLGFSRCLLIALFTNIERSIDLFLALCNVKLLDNALRIRPITYKSTDRLKLYFNYFELGQCLFAKMYNIDLEYLD